MRRCAGVYCRTILTMFVYDSATSPLATRSARLEVAIERRTALHEAFRSGNHPMARVHYRQLRPGNASQEAIALLLDR